MRGFKAKALRALSRKLFPDDLERRYTADGPKGQITHMKATFHPETGEPLIYNVINTIRRDDKAHRLYKKMKRELR